MERLRTRPQLPPATPAGAGVGCVIILPDEQQVYWNSTAAILHGEAPNLSHSFNLAHFVQWYLPEQREYFIQSLYSAQSSFQLALTVAFSQQAIRYQLLPWWLCSVPSKTPAKRAWVGLLKPF